MQKRSQFFLHLFQKTFHVTFLKEVEFPPFRHSKILYALNDLSFHVSFSFCSVVYVQTRAGEKAALQVFLQPAFSPALFAWFAPSPCSSGLPRPPAVAAPRPRRQPHGPHLSAGPAQAARPLRRGGGGPGEPLAWLRRGGRRWLAAPQTPFVGPRTLRRGLRWQRPVERCPA